MPTRLLALRQSSTIRCHASFLGSFVLACAASRRRLRKISRSRPPKPAPCRRRVLRHRSFPPTPAPTLSASASEPPLPPAPPRVPPNDAVKTKSGLAMLVLTHGTGKKHPKPTDTVKRGSRAGRRPGRPSVPPNRRSSTCRSNRPAGRKPSDRWSRVKNADSGCPRHSPTATRRADRRRIWCSISS